jgi:hypothetical protein
VRETIGQSVDVGKVAKFFVTERTGGGSGPKLFACLTRDDPLSFRVEEFEADGEAGFARRLAIGDASQRLKGAGGRREVQAVIDLPPANAEDARPTRADVLCEGCF